MPTNEERQEVAKELRKYRTDDFKDYVDTICELAVSIGVDCMGLDACHGSDEMPECKKRLFDRLADLIEPELTVEFEKLLYKIAADDCMNNSGEKVLTLYGAHGVPDLIVCDGKQYQYERPEITKAISDLKNLQNAMAKDFANSDNCTETCPCYPDCIKHNAISCERLIAIYCADELEKIIRRLDGD